MESKTKKKIALSPAKLAANRANALKSTGPRSPGGKRRSAANARVLMTIDEAPDNPELNLMPNAALDRYLATAQATRSRARKALQANLQQRTQTTQPEASDLQQRTQTHITWTSSTSTVSWTSWTSSTNGHGLQRSLTPHSHAS